MSDDLIYQYSSPIPTHPDSSPHGPVSTTVIEPIDVKGHGYKDRKIEMLRRKVAKLQTDLTNLRRFANGDICISQLGKRRSDSEDSDFYTFTPNKKATLEGKIAECDATIENAKRAIDNLNTRVNDLEDQMVDLEYTKTNYDLVLISVRSMWSKVFPSSPFPTALKNLKEGFCKNCYLASPELCCDPCGHISLCTNCDKENFCPDCGAGISRKIKVTF